jgi:hypothetical protein
MLNEVAHLPFYLGRPSTQAPNLARLVVNPLDVDAVEKCYKSL